MKINLRYTNFLMRKNIINYDKKYEVILLVPIILSTFFLYGMVITTVPYDIARTVKLTHDYNIRKNKTIANVYILNPVKYSVYTINKFFSKIA
jgi:hypothetical protein